MTMYLSTLLAIALEQDNVCRAWDLCDWLTQMRFVVWLLTD